MANKLSGNTNPDRTATSMDYVKSGDLFGHVAMQCVMVESSSDLTNLTDYTPGTVAFTAGFGSMWQLDASGSWQAIGDE